MPETNHLKTPVLEIENLSVETTNALGKTTLALRKISLSVAAGEILVLAGEEESGVSLLSRMAAGLSDPGTHVISGSLRFESESILRARREKQFALRRNSIAFIPRPCMEVIHPSQTVGQWLRHLIKHTRSSAQDVSHCFLRAGIPEQVQLRAQRLIDLPPLMRKRLAIFRALVVGARLLISENGEEDLDPISKVEFFRLLAKTAQESHLAVLVSLGSLRYVLHLSAHIAIFYEGGILEQGSPTTIQTHPTHLYTAEFMASEPALGWPLPPLPVISSQAFQAAEVAVGQWPDGRRE